MATNYPSGLDSLTRPNPTDPLSSPSHAQIHDDVADALEAVETELGLNPSGTYQTVKDRLDDIGGSDGPGGALYLYSVYT